MSETNYETKNLQVTAQRRRARARGARHMVAQGLALYYQSLVHKVHEDTPAFLADVLKRARDPGAWRAN